MKFFFGFLAFIAAVVVVVLLTVSLFRGLDEDASANSGSVSTTYDLKSPEAADTVARYTVSGAITSDENYGEIRITVSKNVRTIEVIKGYNGTVEKTASFPNNPAAYNAFLGALAAAKFSDRNNTEGDPRTTCVMGNRMYYQIQSANEKEVDTWSTTCGARGNFAGLPDPTAQLFRNQIPDYSIQTANVNLAFR